MRQEKYYGVFDDDDLYPGAKIKIEHSVVQGYLDHPVDLSPFIGLDADTLTAKRSESAEAEKVLFEKIRASISEWERQAAVTKTYDRALEYINTPTLEHTSNQWIHDDFLNTDKISNMVYEMTTSIVERTNRETYSRDSHPVVWYASWEVDMHSPKHNCCVEISGVRNKRFTDKAAAQKYIDGRKKAYAKYFQEISPPIPPVALVCNEEGKIEGLPLNRALKTEEGEVYDIISGNFFICGIGEENFCSLSPELAEKFKEEFKHPESFMRLCGKVVAVKEPIPGEGAPGKSHKGQEL